MIEITFSFKRLIVNNLLFLFAAYYGIIYYSFKL